MRKTSIATRLVSLSHSHNKNISRSAPGKEKLQSDKTRNEDEVELTDKQPIYPIYTDANPLFDTYLRAQHPRSLRRSTNGQSQDYDVSTTIFNDPPLFMIEPSLRPTPQFSTRKYIRPNQRLENRDRLLAGESDLQAMRRMDKEDASREQGGAASEWGADDEQSKVVGSQMETELDTALDQEGWNVGDLSNEFAQWDRHATPKGETSSLPAPAEAQTLPPSFVSTLMRFPLISKRVVQQGGKGRMPSWYVLTVAGNGEGLVGFGEGKDTENARAIEKSFIAACKDLDWVDRFEERTLWNEIDTKWGATRVLLRPRPMGFGLRCNPYIHQVCKAAGIKDISAKVWGSRNGMNIIKACLRVLRGGHAPLMMGDGVGGPGTRMDKGLGMRGRESVERERGRWLANARLCPIMPTRAQVATSDDSVEETIAAILQQAQGNVASHKKNVVQLHKIHTQCAQHVQHANKAGELRFNEVIRSMLYHVLPLKKGTTVADRIVRFIGSYTKYLAERTSDEQQQAERKSDDEDTLAARFVDFQIRAFLRGFTSKDKIVRYRSVQLVAEIVTSLGEIDEDLYNILRRSILERVLDKESSVRVQAVIAIGKLYKGESLRDADDEEVSLLDVLCDVIQHDVSGEVRRAALLNTPTTERTLDPIISRIQDVDGGVRKIVFQHSLPQVPHPRVLKIVQRERILRTGLGDRDASVVDASKNLVLKWIEVMNGDLLKFLETFDLVGGDVAEQALFALFEVKPSIMDSIQFDSALSLIRKNDDESSRQPFLDSFWNALTPERAFLARVMVDYCIKHNDTSRIEAVLPVVTALAFLIQTFYNRLIERVRNRDEQLIHPDSLEPKPPGTGHEANWDAEELDLEFIVGELYRMAANADYGDEIGRRKMFALVREMIGQRSLPDGLVPGCLDVLSRLTLNERDFIRLIVEVIQIMRDPGTDMDQEPPADDDEQVDDTPVKRARLFQAPAEKSEDELRRSAETDMRCLSLCTAMLERVMGTFDENSTLDGLLSELIIPAVKSKDSPMRERGMVALGLCCLIHRKMAVNSFGLFLNQVEKASPALQVRALQVIFDMLILYERDLMKPRPGLENPQEQIVEFLLGVLGSSDMESIQYTAALGLSKLLVTSVIDQDRVLQSLVMIYFSPETTGNQRLRQCLSIALPIYACSASRNQERLQRVILPSVRILGEVYEELEEGQEMVAPLQILGTLIDWTDPRNLFDANADANGASYEEVHVDLAIEMMTSMFDEDTHRKLYIQLLSKFYLPPSIDDNKLRKLRYLASSYKLNRPFPDSASRNTFDRFTKSLDRNYADILNGISEEDSRKLEALQELFKFIDDLVPEGDIPAPDGRKRATDNAKKKAKRKRDSSEDSQNGRAEMSPTPPTKRSRPTRAAAVDARTRTQRTEIGSENSSEEEAVYEKSSTKRKRETIEDIDADIDQILGKRVKRTSAGSSLSIDSSHTGGSGPKYSKEDGKTAPESTLPDGSEFSSDDSEDEIAGGLLEGESDGES
ncbi:hypothetical protein FRC17_003121 [Serendipita sp. 399]|nr:hypothetical protein FRC17_003121 [Serendipita sp. 399]